MSFQRRIDTIITLIVLAGSLNAEVKTCTQCTTEYEGSMPATETCTELKTYLTCLETASGDGCPLDATKAANIGTDAEGCTLGSLCTCQKDYWKTALTTEIAKCDAAIARATCLKGTTDTEPAEGTETDTDKACDDGTTFKVLGTTTVTKLKELSTCKPAPTCACEVTHFTSDESDKCTVNKNFISCLVGKTDVGCSPESVVKDLAASAESDMGASCSKSAVCICEIDYTKADQSTDTMKCTVNKNFISCLVGKTEAGCASGSIVKDLATIAESKMGETCDKSAVCICEIDYTKADQSTDTMKCIVNKNFISCLVGKTEAGCASGSIVKDLATIAESKMGATCAKSAICSCEIDFTKADQSTEAKKCTSANEFLSCLDEINNADDKGCNGTVTAASLKSYVESKIQTVFCSSAGFQAEISFTIVCLLLTASAIFST